MKLESHLELVFVISKYDHFTPDNYDDENGLWILNQDKMNMNDQGILALRNKVRNLYSE
jgi:hypothetical protein